MASEIETMTLAEALAYLKPDPANNGTISLRAPKAREAVERIEREFTRLDAIISDKVADTRLVHMGPRGDGFGIDLREGPIPYICEYLAQFMGHGSGDPLSNYAEIEVQHHEIGAMTLTIQRRAGKTPHQIAAAAAEEAKRLREELTAHRSKDREDGAREMRERAAVTAETVWQWIALDRAAETVSAIANAIRALPLSTRTEDGNAK